MFLTQKKGRGIFYLVEKINGKAVWKSTGTADKEKAEAILKEIEASRGLAEQKRRGIRDLIVERATAVSEVLVTKQTSFKNAWEIYLQDSKTADMKLSSLNRVKSCWTSFTDHCQMQGITLVEQVDYTVAECFLKTLGKEKASGTVLLHKRNLHTIFKRIRRPLGLPDNPFTDIYTPRVIRKHHECYTKTELDLIFRTLWKEQEFDWFDLCLLSMWTGMRFGDCCFQRKQDIYPNCITNKNRKLERYERCVCIPVQQGGELQKRLELRCKANPESPYLFPNFVNRYEARSGYFLRWWGNFLKRLNITRSDGILDFHSFRHTFNTELIERHTDVGVRMNLVGHSNVSTNQIYNHATEAAQRAIESLTFPSVIPQEQLE